MRRLLLLALAALAAGALCASAAFAAGLRGPARVHVLDRVTFRATGLRPAARYALRIVRTEHLDGRAYRCSASLAAPRRARGTVVFRGSVPTRATCEAASGTLRSFTVPLRPATWRVLACVPAPRGTCARGAAVARGRLRVVT